MTQAARRQLSTRPLVNSTSTGHNPLGALIARVPGPTRKPHIEIVGVVADFSYRGLREESEQAYFRCLGPTTTVAIFT